MRILRITAGALCAAAMLSSAVVLGPPAQARPGASIDPQVEALLQARLVNPRLGSDVGLIVIDAATGELVADSGADLLQLPASNMKLVTAVATLARIGAATRFPTRVRAGATASDVVLEGGGDPLLTSTNLQRLAKRTARALPPGVPVIVHADTDRFPATGRAPGWTRSYIPSDAATVEALARLGDYSGDPSANAARVFAQALNAQGIPAVLGPDVDAGSATVLAEYTGHTVDEAVSVMLSHSENNVAEVLHRQVAVASGMEASWDGSRKATEAVLRELGIDPTGMALLDGSGLSRKDRLTPRFLASVLRTARVTNPAPFAIMFEPDALPVSGQTGTLITGYGRYVTKHARCARGAVSAKTGSLFDTVALSGVARTLAGSERLFSILVNDRPRQFSALSTRQALDGLTATITRCWN